MNQPIPFYQLPVTNGIWHQRRRRQQQRNKQLTWAIVHDWRAYAATVASDYTANAIAGRMALDEQINPETAREVLLNRAWVDLAYVPPVFATWHSSARFRHLPPRYPKATAKIQRVDPRVRWFVFLFWLFTVVHSLRGSQKAA